MNRINSIGPDLVSEPGEIHAEGVPLEEDDVIWVNGSDNGVDSIIKCEESSPLFVGRLIQKVVACNPSIWSISRGDVLPQVHNPVLKVLVIPKRGVASNIVRVPVLRLATWGRVKVDYGVYVVFRTL